jgi:glycosyltransferase involved in cell wall biosynthesis
MLKVSLIVATLGERPEELCAFLRSLVPQARFIRNVIVVDQNPSHERIPALLRHFRDALPIYHTRSEPGLSRARNHGLWFATGDLVAFPDDDCLYPEGLLNWVVDWFQSNFEYDILAVGAEDASGVASGNRWPQDTCEIRALNAFRTTFSSSLFIWTDLARCARFDEQLGVGAGTPYGSGEETDYILRLLRINARGRFDRTCHVVHPRRDMLSGATSAARARAYGFGMGHVLRLNSLRPLWIGFLGYNLARAGVVWLRKDADGARLCLAQTKGLWSGFLAPAPARVSEVLVPHNGSVLNFPNTTADQLAGSVGPGGAPYLPDRAHAATERVGILHSSNGAEKSPAGSSSSSWR